MRASAPSGSESPYWSCRAGRCGGVFCLPGSAGAERRTRQTLRAEQPNMGPPFGGGSRVALFLPCQTEVNHRTNAEGRGTLRLLDGTFLPASRSRQKLSTRKPCLTQQSAASRQEKSVKSRAVGWSIVGR